MSKVTDIRETKYSADILKGLFRDIPPVQDLTFSRRSRYLTFEVTSVNNDEFLLFYILHFIVINLHENRFKHGDHHVHCERKHN